MALCKLIRRYQRANIYQKLCLKVNDGSQARGLMLYGTQSQVGSAQEDEAPGQPGEGSKHLKSSRMVRSLCQSLSLNYCDY